jgi:hypothetical protein
VRPCERCIVPVLDAETPERSPASATAIVRARGGPARRAGPHASRQPLRVGDVALVREPASRPADTYSAARGADANERAESGPGLEDAGRALRQTLDARCRQPTDPVLIASPAWTGTIEAPR